MDIVSRLMKFRDFAKLSNSQFADRAGIPRPTLSQFLNGRNKRLSDDLTAKLHQAFPALNILWLLFGEGDMLTDANFEFSEGKSDENSLESDTQTAENEPQNEAKPASTTCNDARANEQTAPVEMLATSDFPNNQASSAPDDAIKAVVTDSINQEPGKRVEYIMVFYTDKSYETFRPSSR